MPDRASRGGAFRYLVTGGTGFIGRRLMSRLIEAHGASAVACLVHAASTPEQAAALEDFRARGIAIIDGDLTDPAVAAVPPPPVRVVFHLAANIDTALSERELAVNDVGTRHLLAWLGPTLPGLRVVYTSSVAALDRVTVATGPLTEASPSTPRTAYGRTKLGGEHILRERASRDAFTYTIVRLPTVYGPGAKVNGLFDALFRRAVRRGFLNRIDWPGRCSVMHVDDAAAALLALGCRRDAANEIYCAADPDTPTVGQLSARIAQAAGHPIQPIRPPLWVWSMLRALTWNPLIQRTCLALWPAAFWRFSLIIDDGFWVDSSKMRSLLNSSFVDLDRGLRDMAAALEMVSRLS